MKLQQLPYYLFLFLIVFAQQSFGQKNDFDYNFKINDLKGNTIDFRTFKGKTVFINLWATWCGPCRGEMPSIQKLYEQVDKNEIEFVMLSIDNLKQTEKVKKYVNDKSFTFPVYTLSGEFNTLPEQLQVPSIPVTFIIDKNGTVVMKEVGMKNYNTSKMKKLLTELIKK